MPYSLKKQRGKPLYWVVDNTGRKYEHEPIPLARAKKQLIALHINTRHGGKGIGILDPEVYRQLWIKLTAGNIPDNTIQLLNDGINHVGLPQFSIHVVRMRPNDNVQFAHNVNNQLSGNAAPNAIVLGDIAEMIYDMTLPQGGMIPIRIRRPAIAPFGPIDPYLPITTAPIRKPKGSTTGKRGGGKFDFVALIAQALRDKLNVILEEYGLKLDRSGIEAEKGRTLSESLKERLEQVFLDGESALTNPRRWHRSVRGHEGYFDSPEPIYTKTINELIYVLDLFRTPKRVRVTNPLTGFPNVPNQGLQKQGSTFESSNPFYGHTIPQRATAPTGEQEEERKRYGPEYKQFEQEQYDKIKQEQKSPSLLQRLKDKLLPPKKLPQAWVTNLPSAPQTPSFLMRNLPDIPRVSTEPDVHISPSGATSLPTPPGTVYVTPAPLPLHPRETEEGYVEQDLPAIPTNAPHVLPAIPTNAPRYYDPADSVPDYAGGGPVFRRKARVMPSMEQRYRNRQESDVEYLPEVESFEPRTHVDTGIGGKKLAHIKRYLKGMGIRATKANIDHAICAADSEGVVW